MTAKSNYAKQGSTTSTKNNKLELITYSYKKISFAYENQE